MSLPNRAPPSIGDPTATPPGPMANALMAASRPMPPAPSGMNALVGLGAAAPAGVNLLAIPGRVAPPAASMPTGPMPSPATPGASVTSAAMPPASPQPGTVDAVVQQIGAAGMQATQLAKAAAALEHSMDLTGDLLSRRTITGDALKGAVTAAKAAGKLDPGAVDGFAGRLPPTSDQPALRAALEQHLRSSMTQLVAVHSAATKQGLDLAGTLRANPDGAPN